MSVESYTQQSSRAATVPLALALYVLGTIALGISAFVGGVALMRNPKNDPLGMPNEWLDGTPFPDYFVPGLTLFGVFGLGSVAVLVGIARRRTWAWAASVGLGAAQVVWILAEVAFLRTVQPLHAIYGSLGAALVALATRPAVRDYLRSVEGADA